VIAGNHPTPNQNGTGQRVGLFQDAGGTIWGLPLIVSSGGELLACAPALLHDQQVTDTFPRGSAIVGATNEPTGWRGGTGELELLLRDSRGVSRRQAIHGAELAAGFACRAPESPGPPQLLHYYRLAPRPPIVN